MSDPNHWPEAEGAKREQEQVVIVKARALYDAMSFSGKGADEVRLCRRDLFDALDELDGEG